ncbi:uncharacterized protein LAJ45_10237 [Morchella importuna]|uniref:uncharacterized protein n=1 Tax=Morchella importuna TaxID=1174673 RepID=UPI001E8E430A|nr:uncharacterized protein LAJ45_10237 [Morchella importuna]KAH8145760.1 hypothetical protein LAJ45_10237 [Morchella importuna]
MRESKLCHGIMAMLGINMLTRRASFQFFLSWAHIFGGLSVCYIRNEDVKFHHPISVGFHTHTTYIFRYQIFPRSTQLFYLIKDYGAWFFDSIKITEHTAFISPGKMFKLCWVEMHLAEMSD